MRRYGIRSEYPERLTDCMAGVHSFGAFSASNRQCFRKRGYGPDGLYCKQHAAMVRDGEYVWVPEDS